MRESIRLYATLIAMAAIGAITAPSPAAAVGANGADVRGVAQVIDGDTLLIGETRVRLEGIDAPESSQTCSRRWIGHWNCGRAAARELARLTAGRTVDCRHHGIDASGVTAGCVGCRRSTVVRNTIRDWFAAPKAAYEAVRRRPPARVTATRDATAR